MKRDHGFHTMAFDENLHLGEIAAHASEANLSAHHLRIAVDAPGDTLVSPFGAARSRHRADDFAIIVTLARAFG